MSEKKIPSEFLCPITLTIMKDPVIMPDGQTYERTAIADALKHSPISPLTRKPMKIEDAIPNYSLKSLITSFNNQKIINIPKNNQKISNITNIKLKNYKAEAIINPENSKNLFVNVSLEPEKIENRKPILLIAMIDVSGSMKLDACEQIQGIEDMSFSRLSFVKHSLKTVISILNNDDKVSLITFHKFAKLILAPIKANEIGKNMIFDAIKKIKPQGATNIWDALRMAINLTKNFNNYNICLMLFTDGELNENPPLGIIPSLKEYLSDIKINFTISTFFFWV